MAATVVEAVQSLTDAPPSPSPAPSFEPLDGAPTKEGVLRASRLYERLLVILCALLPVPVISYLYAFQDPALLFVSHSFHEGAIAAALLQSSFVSYVTWRCYASSGEPVLRWLTLAFVGFTLVYLPHGVLTRLSGHHMPLFLLFGPVSRLVMALCLLIGLFVYGRPHHSTEQRGRARFWGGWIGGFVALDAVVTYFALKGVVPFQPLRIGIELVAVAVYLVSIALMRLRRVSSAIMLVYAISLASFAESSVAFVLGKPWNHMWWLAHFVFSIGFTILSYGVIRAFHTTRAFARVFSQEEMMRQLAEAKAFAEDMAAQLKTANENLEILAATDPLTGLSNRRQFLVQSQTEFARATRSGEPLTVLALDIDHFKDINDQAGHRTGDKVLQRFAEVVSRHLRPTDAIGRVGGEEFMILLPGTSSAEARAIAERTRVAVAQEGAGDLEPPVRVTVSMGLAEFPTDGATQEEVFSKADARLYLAKGRGRNQVADGS